MSGNGGGGEADQWWSFGLAAAVGIAFSSAAGVTRATADGASDGGWSSDEVARFFGGKRRRCGWAAAWFEGWWWRGADFGCWKGRVDEGREERQLASQPVGCFGGGSHGGFREKGESVEIERVERGVQAVFWGE
ncbi:hypothetical protein P3S68_014706 [Capsicum galapagoense]